MDYPKRSDIPTVPAGDCRRVNEVDAPSERSPEIAQYLEKQKDLLDALLEKIVNTESMLSPVLRAQPPDGSKEEKARIKAMTYIGGILDEHNVSLDNMLGKLAGIHKRLEI